MKIHLLSDVHLESGPYQLPSDLDCDVIVAAGDIGFGTEGVEWLKTLEKPVIYVLGNHEYWTKKDAPVDMSVILKDIKDAAAGSNVHVLENEFITIDDVRFFGATFWTNLGKFNTTLIDEAHHMRDYTNIYCKGLYEDKNFLARFYRCVDRYCALEEIDDNSYRRHVQEQYINTGRFHPFVGYLLNEKSWKTIQEKILYRETQSDASFSKTVVVTHHHPSYQSLRLDGLTENEIYPTGVAAGNGRQPNGRMYQTAAYASELTFSNFGFCSDKPRIDAWLCGHIHRKMNYAFDGTRVICNPRGRHMKPMTEDSAKAYALFGLPISEESVQESQQRFAANPFQGDGVEFDASLLIDLRDGAIPPLRSEFAQHIPELLRWHAEIQQFAGCMKGAAGPVIKALEECIETRADEFEKCVRELEMLIKKNTNTFADFSTAGLNYETYRHQFSIGDDAVAVSEKNNAMITAQNSVIQKLMAFAQNGDL
ncbi:metallophosphoesterase [Undibacterium curvum]|uniref:Metallophosphoesterase n=1 Tax=Undibacterium curvum TaxID=2762294 RepID=A0ABR7A6T0_9BURK|nr:metallophosphoesterase [Undibacterium curvum]MBC3932606.1 metallophosphoesterase [Undibacterium curvum]